MKKAFKVIALIAAGMLVIGIAFAGFGSLLGGKLFGYAFNIGSKSIRTADDMVEDSIELEPFDELLIKTTSSDITIKYGDENRINYKLPADLVPDIDEEDGKLSIVKKNTNELDFDINFGYVDQSYIEIIVNNPGLKKVDISTTSGGVDIKDLDLEGTINSNSGEIYIENCKAGNDLDVNLTSGSVVINTSVFKKLDVDETSGSIGLHSIEANSIDLSSVSGEIEIQDCKAEKLKGSCTSGSIEANNSVFDNITTHNVSGETSFLNVKTKTVDSDSTSGSITFLIEGIVDDYDFSVKATSGSVEVGNKKYEHKYERKEGNANSVSATVISGDVIIGFTEDN